MNTNDLLAQVQCDELPPPYVPSQQDWEEYARWLDSLKENSISSGQLEPAQSPVQ